MNQLHVLRNALLLLLALAVFVVLSLPGAFTFQDPVQYWRDSLGEDFAYVKEVHVRELGALSYSFYTLFCADPTETLDGISAEEKLSNLIETMRTFSYDGMQSDPALLEVQGVGNCQAFTLYAKALLDRVDVENAIVLEDSHMYNRVQTEAGWYSVDFAKGTLIKEGE